MIFLSSINAVTASTGRVEAETDYLTDLGATAIIPGQFNAWGSGASVYFLLTGITGLAIVGYSGWPEQVFYGGALIVAVVLSQIAKATRARSAARAA